ncbi:hypothetical protein D3C71_1523660 [compost metagenome]
MGGTVPANEGPENQHLRQPDTGTQCGPLLSLLSGSQGKALQQRVHDFLLWTRASLAVRAKDSAAKKSAFRFAHWAKPSTALRVVAQDNVFWCALTCAAHK